MRTIKRDIAGAVIFSNDEHILLGQSRKGGVYEDSWVIPAGGIEEGETKEQALIREVFEEVDIDVTLYAKEMLSNIQKGTTEKTMKNTSERVLVDMTFYNFRVDIDSPAEEIKITLKDDLRVAEWVPFSKLNERKYSPSVHEILVSLGLLK